ncbi:MAG: hypothetical protein DRN24_05885, partial [Thermoplasmata archaeon]
QLISCAFLRNSSSERLPTIIFNHPSHLKHRLDIKKQLKTLIHFFPLQKNRITKIFQLGFNHVFLTKN